MKKLLAVAMAYVKRGRRKRCGEKNTWHAVAASRMEGAGARHVLFVCSRSVPAAHIGVFFIFQAVRQTDKTRNQLRVSLLCATRFQRFLLSFAGALRYKWVKKVPTLPALYPEASEGGGGSAMTFEELLDQAIALLRAAGA